MAGVTQSTNFPTTEFAERRHYIGNSDDAFVSRFDAVGQLAASTYLGGSDTEVLYSLASDSEGFAYVTGDTASLGYPVTPDAIQTKAQGSDDAFVTRLNRDCAIVYSTFLGSSSPEEGRAIAVDTSGDLYVSGRSGPDFPHSPDAVTTLQPENNWTPFLVKIVPRQAMGRAAIASSQESDALGPTNAIDGDPLTRWSSAFADPQQLIIDLGRPVVIDRVVLDWETAYGHAYDVLVSDDQQTWRIAYSTDSGDGGIVDIHNLQVTGRYLAVNGRERGTEWGYSLWDVAVFGAAVEVVNQPPNVALSSPTGETRFVAPAQINISASALDTDGTVARVVFYVNGAQIGAATTAPYSITYAAAAGAYTIVAEAVDNLGTSSSTNPITVYVLSETDLGPDLALGRPVSASSVEAPGLEASNAVDGSLTSRWSSAFSDPQWLSVNLGRRYQLNTVILRWETAAAQLFDVQVSDDGSAWTTIYNLTSATGGTEVLPVSGVGRYVRILGRLRTTQWGYSLWEFQAYGTPVDNGNGGVNIAPGGQAFASSVENSGLAAPRTIDGDAGTRWSSAFADGEWLAVDLGAPYDVSRVVLRWETASRGPIRNRGLERRLGLAKGPRRRRPRRWRRPDDQGDGAVRPDVRHTAGDALGLFAVGVRGVWNAGHLRRQPREKSECVCVQHRSERVFRSSRCRRRLDDTVGKCLGRRSMDRRRVRRRDTAHACDPALGDRVCAPVLRAAGRHVVGSLENCVREREQRWRSGRPQRRWHGPLRARAVRGARDDLGLLLVRDRSVRRQHAILVEPELEHSGAHL